MLQIGQKNISEGIIWKSLEYLHQSSSERHKIRIYNMYNGSLNTLYGNETCMRKAKYKSRLNNMHGKTMKGMKIVKDLRTELILTKASNHKSK